MQPKIEFIDKRSEEIYQKREHALIGISPFNSYYNEEKIEKIIQFIAGQNFEKYDVFLADEMSVYNLLGLGYSEKEATSKTKKRDRNLRNKTLKIFERLNIETSHLLTYEELCNKPKYQIYFEKHNMEIIGEPNFRALLDEVMENLKFEGKYTKITQKNISINYFAAEMPLLLNTPDLLAVPSSIFIYCNIGGLHKELYINKEAQSNNQGFCSICFA